MPKASRGPVVLLAEQAGRERDGGELRGEQHADGGDVAHAELEAPAGEDREDAHAEPDLRAEQQREMALEPAPAAEPEDEGAEERECGDHASGDSSARP
jgi:hypothetical protein